MGKERTIKSCKKELQQITHHIKWEDLEINKVYHVPPIITLNRMDIVILSKDNDTITFKEVGSSKNEESKMHKTSILSRFLVRKKEY